VLELEMDRGLGFDRESGCRSLVCVCFVFVFCFVILVVIFFILVVVVFFINGGLMGWVISIRGAVITIIFGVGQGLRIRVRCRVGLGKSLSIGGTVCIFIVDLLIGSSAVLGQAFWGYLIQAKRLGAHWEGSHVRVSGRVQVNGVKRGVLLLVKEHY
jgi:hypothetical protein